MMSNLSGVLRIVQLTDTHLFADSSRELLKLNTQDSFEKVLGLIAARERDLDLVVGTGDISQDASDEAYLRFCEGMQTLDAPFRWLPGNHDSRAVMDKVGARMEQQAGIDMSPSVNLGSWQIIMLDSAVP